MISADIQKLIDSVNGQRQTKAVSSTEEMQNRFLTLLTTQLQNQDPLNPMDNAQLTSQLAQINTVSGIEKLNATLEKMMASTSESEVMQAAALVGHNVMVEGRGISLTEAGGVGGIELASAASNVTVTIKDGNGLVVRTLSLPRMEAGINNFYWDGKNDAGTDVSRDGAYTFEVAAVQGETNVTVKGLQLASVTSISRGSDGIRLDLGGLGLVTMNDIKQIF